jgi:hypothetical protein
MLDTHYAHIEIHVCTPHDHQREAADSKPLAPTPGLWPREITARSGPFPKSPVTVTESRP